VKDKKFLIALGKKIRSLRMERGMSQLDLGVAMDNYAEQIGRIERGLQNVTICTLKKLCEALDITLADLFKNDPH
jgi:transcriptional regulator with XRE-family HTH domain